MLRGYRAIPAEVLQIIQQHHEDRTGLGFPAGLRDRDTFMPAKVVGVVDEFCDLIFPSPGGEARTPAEALRHLMTFRRQARDPAILRALAEVVESKPPAPAGAPPAPTKKEPKPC
jgi:HD-GYP domain-containing protein (c-di-GMP phosphodiesterase class II)